MQQAERRRQEQHPLRPADWPQHRDRQPFGTSQFAASLAAWPKYPELRAKGLQGVKPNDLPEMVADESDAPMCEALNALTPPILRPGLS
jgi:hypothetical protein